LAMVDALLRTTLQAIQRWARLVRIAALAAMSGVCYCIATEKMKLAA